MSRFTTSGGGEGTPGPQGPAGNDGEDALWNFIGEYDNGADYSPGDLVTYNGGTYYRVGEPNPGYPPGTSYWTTIAEPGQTSDLGDFVFTAGTATVNDNETLLIQANNADTVKSQLVLDPNNGIAKLQAFDNPNVTTFYASSPDWDSATWAVEPGIGSVINFVNAPNILNWIATSSQSVYNASMVINGVPAGTVNGFSYNGTDATLFINTTVPTEDPTVNEIGFSFITSSFIDINYDNGSFDIEANNMDVNIRSDDDVYITANGDDILLRANDDIRFTTMYNDPNLPNQQWTMNSEGGLEFPGSGLISNSSDSDDITISSNSGQFLNDSTIPGNQIATIENINATVSTERVRYSPTFEATGLAFTGSDTTYPTYNSYYVKSGKMVSFVIEVDCSTVTNFGTGQFKLQLPFTPAFGFNHFTGWAWADPDVSPDTGTGHTIINADTAGVTDVLDLHYLKSAGGANAAIREGLFLQGTPVTLSTISKIYVNGTYIAQ